MLPRGIPSLPKWVRLKAAGRLLLTLLLFYSCTASDSTHWPDSRLQADLPPHWAIEGIAYSLILTGDSYIEGTDMVLRRLPILSAAGVNILMLKIGRISKHNAQGAATDSVIKTAHELGMKVVVCFRFPSKMIVSSPEDSDNIFLEDYKFFESDSSLAMALKDSLQGLVEDFDADGFFFDATNMTRLAVIKPFLNGLKKEYDDLFLASAERPIIEQVSGFQAYNNKELYRQILKSHRQQARTSEVLNVVHDRRRGYPRGALAINYLENRESQRSMSVFGVAAIRGYIRLLFTLPGLPVVQAGQEFGARDDDGSEGLKKSWPANPANASGLIGDYFHLMQLRRSSKALQSGQYLPLPVSMLKGAAGAFMRTNSDEAFLVLCNLQRQPAEKLLAIAPDSLRQRWKGHIFYNIDDSTKTVTLDSLVFESLYPFSTEIYKATL